MPERRLRVVAQRRRHFSAGDDGNLEISRREFLNGIGEAMFAGGMAASALSAVDHFLIHDPKEPFVEQAREFSHRPEQEDMDWAKVKIDRITEGLKELADSGEARRIPVYLDEVRPTAERVSAILDEEIQYNNTLERLSEGAGGTRRAVDLGLILVGAGSMVSSFIIGNEEGDKPNIVQRLLLKLNPKFRRK